MPETTIDTHKFHYDVVDDCVVIRPDGACNEKKIESLATLADSEFATRKNLILDLSGAEYVDSPGFRWIVRQVRSLKGEGRRLLLAGLQPTVKRAYKLLLLDKIVPAFDTPEDALADLGVQSNNGGN